MGHIIKMLQERKTGSIYNNEAWLEIEECIHFHWRDLRIILSKEDFLGLSKMFRDAEEQYRKLGCPEKMDKMTHLANAKFTGGLARGRLGIEYQKDDTVHVHYHDLRIHFKIADFLIWADVFQEAFYNLPDILIREIEIGQCVYHPVVKEYLKILEEYDMGKHSFTLENPAIIKSKIIDCWSKVGDYKVRNLGFPQEYPGDVPKELDRQYLIAIYESMKKGYAKEKYKRCYVVAYKLRDKIYLTGAHRVASLIHLGYTKIKVYLVEPESNWKEK